MGVYRLAHLVPPAFARIAFKDHELRLLAPQSALCNVKLARENGGKRERTARHGGETKYYSGSIELQLFSLNS